MAAFAVALDDPTLQVYPSRHTSAGRPGCFRLQRFARSQAARCSWMRTPDPATVTRFCLRAKIGTTEKPELYSLSQTCGLEFATAVDGRPGFAPAANAFIMPSAPSNMETADCINVLSATPTVLFIPDCVASANACPALCSSTDNIPGAIPVQVGAGGVRDPVPTTCTERQWSVSLSAGLAS